jgi:elongation factor P
MIEASELRAGTVFKLDGELYTVVSTEYHAAAAQLGGMVFAKAKSVSTNHIKELRFHPGDRIEDVELEHKVMEYLYTDGTEFYFMNPDTFEQLSLSKEMIGPCTQFLQPNMCIPIVLYQGSPVSITFPPAVELRVVSAPPALREHETSTYKTVVLEHGLEVLVPQFIKEDDTVKIEVATGKYLERVKREGRKI